jgi:acetyl esterase/lipase
VRISPADGPARGTYLHIHGGGWTFGAADQYDDTNQWLARETGARVVSVAYRLGPEHRWPAAAEDCHAAALWALESSDGPVVIGGESAGAHLAAVTLLRLRAGRALGRMAGAALTYGMFDLRGTPSVRSWGARYLVLNTPIIDWFVGNLLGEVAGRADPEVSPLLADLAGLPPALFEVGTADPLLDDTLFMAARWRAAGNDARLSVTPGGIHGFDQFPLAVADAALDLRAAFIAACLTG